MAKRKASTQVFISEAFGRAKKPVSQGDTSDKACEEDACSISPAVCSSAKADTVAVSASGRSELSSFGFGGAVSTSEGFQLSEEKVWPCWEERRFRSEWCNAFEWLHYDIALDAAFCH